MKHFIATILLLLLLGSTLAIAADTPATMPSAPRHFTVIALTNPRSITIDQTGNLYVGDIDTGNIHQISPAGDVTLVGGSNASSIKNPLGIALGPDGAIYLANADDNAVSRVSSDGTVAPLTRQAGEPNFSGPISVAVDTDGNVFVANNGDNTILKITPQGVASVFAGKSGASGSDDGAGAAARFASPRGLAIDRQNNLYVADEGNSNIRKITPAGVVSTLAGTAGQTGSADGEATAARFAAPRALAADTTGAVYVADTDNHCIRKITAAGTVSTLAGEAGKAGMVDGVGNAARFSEPRGIAVDAAGNVYVADTGNSAVRQITPDGAVTTIAAAAAPQAAPPPVPVPTTAPTSFVPIPAPVIAPLTGQTERLDYSHAQTLDGWDADPKYWSVKDGVFTAKGEKVPSTFLLTQKNYSDFRITLTSQMAVSENHAGVCLWGERTVSSNGKNQWAYKGPLVIFPGLALWDYITNKNIPVDPVGKALAKKIAGQHDWIHVEILAQGNRIRVAYNGQQVLDWREPNPSRFKPGPIGLQLHGYTKPQEVIYKDVVIESFPKDDRLITVKP